MTTVTAQPDAIQARTRKVSPVHPSDLISLLLKEQATLTAVEEFSSWHQTQSEPDQARYYRNLLPVSMPGPGQQLAFEVDLDQCSGCKACVVACHSLNGLDQGESFRDVGLLVSGREETPLFQHVTTACHHCIEPGCLSACPVNAYEKDPVTGIVRHLDDQCFGCQYCTLACPYEVPKYHAAKGIVRKCDMCTQRLSAGEAPACVQACPHQAISIKTIDIAATKADALAGRFLANSPDPCITLPTTRFVGKATTLESLQAGNYASRPLEHAHWPLILLLVLSQVAVGIVGLVLAGQLLGGASEENSVAIVVLLAIASSLAACSAISSTLHLGRPQFAYRAILGFGHSWLSREIVAFGGFIPLCGLSTVLAFMKSPWLNLGLASAAVFGTCGVAASVMIYHVTHRPFWNARRSGLAFVSTLLGASSSLVMFVLLVAGSADSTTIRMLASLAGCSALLKLAARLPCVASNAAIAETSELLTAKLQVQNRLQLTSELAFLALSSLLLYMPECPAAIGFASVATFFAFLGDFTERYLFFRAVVPLRMPGVSK